MISRNIPNRPLALARLAALSTLVLALSAGCDVFRDETPPPLVPAIRLVGARTEIAEDRALERFGFAKIGDVDRPSFTVSRAFTMRPVCKVAPDAPGFRECTLALPPILPRTPWAIVETLLPPEGQEAETAEPSPEEEEKAAAEAEAHATPIPHLDAETGEHPVAPERAQKTAFTKVRQLMHGLAGVPVSMRVRLPESTSGAFTAYTIPPLAKRTIDTPEIVLPGGGLLRTWIGIEEPAWDVDSARVVFLVERIEMEDGREKRTRLARRMLDPARREQDRGWHQLDVPLPDLGEKPFRLEFKTLPANREDVRPSLPVWGDPTILRPEQAERRHARRVVLISLDTLRTRSMSAYGYELDTTPSFTKLIEEGTLFLRAFTTFSNTLGSHMSMLTGLYPAKHQVRGSAPLDEALPTLAEQMRLGGYETAAFTEDALLSAKAGFRRGFARYFENKDVKSGGGDAEGTFGRAIEWAERQGDEPYFLFVHTYEVHSPYIPPEYTEEAFAGAPSPAGPGLPKRAYEREIRHLDRLLADFLAKLTALGPPEELLLVITADHGEEFQEHGAVTHSQLYDEVMHVPMFFRWPGVVPAGLEIEAPVSLVDVVPTILALTSTKATAAVDGLSLVPLLEGAQIEREIVFGEVPPSIITHKTRWFVARAGNAKCMVADKGTVRCFDLTTDPNESKPIPAESRPDLAALAQEATGYRDLSLKAETARGKPAQGIVADEADPERREKLKMLGYVE
ncbi:MAG: sulfatase [Deltaproteobacteria bacterium]|nr:sulfatase [Deltaproteobacteria bacterium]